MQIPVAMFVAVAASIAALFALAGWALRGIAFHLRAAGSGDYLRTAEAALPDPVETLLEGITDGIIVGDRDGNLNYWNSAALRLHGYASLDDVRRHLSDFRSTFQLTYADGRVVPYEEWPMIRLMREGSLSEYELGVRRTDVNRRMTIRYAGTSIPSADGGASRVVLTMQDVTKRCDAEAELRESQLHLKELIESLPQLVWTCRGQDGARDYLSPQFVQYTGVSAAAQLGYGWLAQVHPDDREETIGKWKQITAAGSTFDCELRIRRADGAYRWFQSRAVPLRDAAGKVSKWLGTDTDIHDHRLAAEQAAVLAAIVEHSEDAIIAKSLAGVMTSWNRAAERLFGYRADETVGQSVTMLLPTARLHEEEHILSQLASGGAIEHFESQRLTKDGRLIDVALTISPIRDANGRVIGASKIVRDISARLAADRALHASHALLCAVVEGITDPVYVKDVNGRYLLANSALAAAVGRTTTQVIGATDVEIFGAERAAMTWEADTRIMACDIPQTYEESVQSDEGVRHYVTTKACYRDADGRVAGVLGISRDITSRRQAEQAVHASEQHLRGVLDSLLVYVAVLKPGGRLEGMNRAARQVFEERGIRAEDVDGIALFDAPLTGMAPEVRATLRAAISRSAMGEEVRLEAVCVLEGPPRIVVDVMLAPMRSSVDARVSHLIVSAVDVTERERAASQARDRQAQLAHLERVRTMGQMASGLAHELNQPLGAITNYAGACERLLASGRLTPERLVQALADIRSEALRAGAIIGRLRSFVKKQHPQVTPIAVNLLVEETVRLLAFDLRHAEIAPRLTLAEELPAAIADAVQVGQVLINLVRNSLDAMVQVPPSRRVLEIETSPEGGEHVRIAVRDAGCGVPPQDVDRIFDSFYTTKPGGLGVGLALCRTIVEDHGGHLTARPNPAGGMTFAFTLRCASHPTQPERGLP